MANSPRPHERDAQPSGVPPAAREHIHFVTGRLAEHALRAIVPPLAEQVGFDYSITTLNITVAALMSVDWLARKLELPEEPAISRIVLPGYCSGELSVLETRFGIRVERGPKDLRNLPEFFGQASRRDNYGAYDIEILAEINHCPKLSLGEILAQADALRRDGADLIDVGCIPGHVWPQLGETIQALRDQGHRVSVDSLDPTELAAAVAAGAELILSINSSNRQYVAEWGCPVVVIPDDPHTLSGLDETIDCVAAAGVPLRIDPVLEPIGFGFAASLGRYLDVRRRYPDAEMMMGIGNLTELTDADSAGINVLLLGFCQELSIRSVLTTQVINWARSSVRECDLARRLTHYAVQHRVLPKHLEPALVMLRDARLQRRSDAELAQLAEQIRDPNYRLFAEDERLHALASGQHYMAEDAYTLFEAMLADRREKLTPGHAFYLGYELAKATIARQLGKQYEQDQPLDWGLLSVAEQSHRIGWGKPPEQAQQTDTSAGRGADSPEQA